MYVSKYNVVIDLHEQKDVSVIHNLFHGRASFVGREVASILKPIIGHEAPSLGRVELDLRDRHFIYEDCREEDEEIAHVFNLFKSHLALGNPGRKYEILLNYDCNLRCVYCFQKKLRGGSIRNEPISDAQLDSIFEAITTIEAQNDQNGPPTESAVLSLVGGEPLLLDPRHQVAIKKIAGFAASQGYRYSFTTNGVNLASYLDTFESCERKPSHIQITVDGPRRIHDKRRIAIGGGGSFDKIVNSIDLGLNAAIPIGLRVNVDMMNIDSISELGALICSRGWDRMSNFSAYLAPVTDHSAVNRNYRWIKTDASIIGGLIKLFEAEPQLEELFTMKNFRGFNQVKELSRGERVAPVFWRCEAVLGQLVFDPDGDLYTCFEASGNDKAKVGRYFPTLEIEQSRLRQWTTLNSFESPTCNDCRFRFTCASGCPWHIVGQGITECLPIEEELDLAWNHFAPAFLKKLAVPQFAPAPLTS